MKVAIRYNSKESNTRQLAFAIQEELGIAAEPMDIPIPSGVELLFFGSSTYKGKMINEISDFIATIKGRNIKVISFGSAIFKKKNYIFLFKQMRLAKIMLLPEKFSSGSIFKIFRYNQPNEKDLQQIKKFSKEIIRKYLY